jgi:hypothetical protein
MRRVENQGRLIKSLNHRDRYTYPLYDSFHHSIRYCWNALEVQDAVLGWYMVYHESDTWYWLAMRGWRVKENLSRHRECFKELSPLKKERSRNDLVSSWRKTLAVCASQVFEHKHLNVPSNLGLRSFKMQCYTRTGISHHHIQEIVKPYCVQLSWSKKRFKLCAALSSRVWSFA